ncbi:amidase family protein [Longispora albida]|uniref:amidase family protein n=1 Tax=Longispora albida TaxID=203523 RepID=UPI00035F0B1B|nr:amidase family protein [Longispora albida]
MRRWKKFLLVTVSVVVVLGVVAAVALWWFVRTIPDRLVDSQVDRQYSTPSYQGARPPDLTPFAADLGAVSDAQLGTWDSQIAGADIRGLREQMAAGRLTAEQLTLYYLKRIEKYDSGKLRAVLTVNPDALTVARDKDRERAAATPGLGAMHGIPVLLKDNIATGDRMPTTAGAAVLRDARSSRDAFIVARLREAGAIILGKTNLSEWSYYMDSEAPSGFSVLGGQTRSAYGKYDVGGSSSGSAVAASARLAAVTVGAETTGSLIYPASQNSVFALHPSIGLLSGDRIIPISGAVDTAGPMSRTVPDLAVLLNGLRGPGATGTDAEAARSLAATDFTTFLSPGGLSGLRVGVLPSGAPRDGDQEIKDRAIANLKAAGAVVKDVSFPEDDVTFVTGTHGDVLRHDFRRDVDSYLTETAAPVASLAEVVAFNKQDLANRAPWGQKLLEEALGDPGPDHAAESRARARAAIDRTLRDNQADILLSLANNDSIVYAHAGYPAISVPAGYRASGEPLGLTLIGGYLDDGRLIRAAYDYEQRFKPRKDPAL